MQEEFQLKILENEEPRKLEDNPGLIIEDFAGEYKVITQREEGVGYFTGTKKYITRVYSLFPNIQKYPLMESETINLEAAAANHYLQLNHLLELAA
jgi:hypothetical protein